MRVHYSMDIWHLSILLCEQKSKTNEVKFENSRIKSKLFVRKTLSKENGTRRSQQKSRRD